MEILSFISKIFIISQNAVSDMTHLGMHSLTLSVMSLCAKN